VADHYFFFLAAVLVVVFSQLLIIIVNLCRELINKYDDTRSGQHGSQVGVFILHLELTGIYHGKYINPLFFAILSHCW